MIKRIVFVGLLLVLLLISATQLNVDTTRDTPRIISHEVNLSETTLQFFHKNKEGKPYSNAGDLKHHLKKEGKELLFAMNGGMYLKDQSPQGLYIENGKVIKSTDQTQEAYGNFYMQPNGVFLIEKNNKARVVPTKELTLTKDVLYATQSGPMLVIDGKLHPKFNQGSTSLFVRNGVGVLPNGNLLFAISKERINFYDFASYFKNQGCQNALYLDGFVSRMYLPAKKWEQTDGGFGVIIAEIK
ncbi:MAG: phosphodiester glycosidase family protein [Flavobacteriales bacterium]|nr:phosphodiester glycosidase family protein [Flavobacteriales bacterium]